MILIPRQYQHVLRVRQAGRLVAGGLIGRLEIGGLTLAIVLLVHRGTGSFAASGRAAAAYLLLTAAARPVQGWVLDLYEPRSALRVIAFVHAGVMTAFAITAAFGLSAMTAIVLAAMTGLTLPVLSAFIRLAWADGADTDATLSSSFALDSVLYEIALTAGPLLVSLLVISSVTWLPLSVLGLAGLTGALVVTWAGASHRTAAKHPRGVSRGDDPPKPPRSASRGDDPPKPPRSASRGDDRSKPAGAATRRLTLGAGVLRLVILQAFIGFGLGALAVSVPALAAQAGALNWSGLLLSALFAGSMIGGLAYGARNWTGPARHRLMIALSSITLFLVLFRLLPALPAKGAALLLAGLSVAPGLTVVLSLVPRLAHRGHTAGAFSWLSFAEPAGAGTGSWLAGLAASAHMLPFAMWLPAAGAAAALVISALPWKAMRRAGMADAAGPADRAADIAG